MSLNIQKLGQVFTPDDVVSLMLSLRQQTGRVLEPSAGNGAFSTRIPGCVAIELDKKVAPTGALVMDFFSYPETERFETVIGNPPYVRYQDIAEKTKRLLDGAMFDGRSNLFLFFIEKAIRQLTVGGELIFIVPREFIKLTAAKHLNSWLFEQGTITHWIETGDTRIFDDAVPNCAIFRFVRGDFSRQTLHRTIRQDNWTERVFCHMNGQLAFISEDLSVPLSSLFEVKVGAVSGADDIFEHKDGNLDFVCSKTIDTGVTRRMIYNVRHPSLKRHKARLLQRKVKEFDETNWWRWGRAYFQSDAPRIYVNAKTRRAQPFFSHSCTAYDGSILALFPKDPEIDVQRAIHLLNNEVPWDELGFVVDGRFLFSQRTLANCLLPKIFNELRALHIVGPDKKNRSRGSEARKAVAKSAA